MFGRLRKPPAAPSEHPLRAMLFGDLSLDDWGVSGQGKPWSSFQEAARLRDGDPAGAREALQAVLAEPGLESRHYLQAWHALRALGVAPPPEEAKRVYGVVVDVPLETGVDTLAAYEDGSARYLNFAGGAAVWDHPDSSLDECVEALLAAGRALAPLIGPWEGVRPALTAGQARLSMLTPSGLHFGQASFDDLARNPMGAPVIGAATALMQALIAGTGAPPGG